MPKFGDRFRTLREKLGMNQEELINDFNTKYHYSFSKSAVSQYENNKRIPEIDALLNFADYFGVTMDYLLGRSNNPLPFKEESTTVKEAEELYKVDPEMFIQMCRARNLSDEERKRIKEYSAFVLEKHLKEKNKE